MTGEAMPPLPLVTVHYIIVRKICPRRWIAAAVFKNHLLAASRVSRQIEQQFVATSFCRLADGALLCNDYFPQTDEEVR